MGKIFTFSGPRGVGKTSLIDDLREKCDIQPIVPYTTREPREDEVEGHDYHFVSDREFDAIRRTRGMFDVLTLRGKKYGTPLEEFDKVIGGPSGEVQYVRSINLAASSAIELRKEIGESAIKSVFIMPECWDDIGQQMRDKGIPEEQILERRSTEPTDLTMLPQFDQIVINKYGQRDDAFRTIAQFISHFSGVELSYE